MKRSIDTRPPKPHVLIVGIQTPYNPVPHIESYFDEFRNLVRSSGREYVAEMYVKLRHVEPATCLTKGKVLELKQLCEQKHIQEVVLSEPLSIAQERNLSRILGCDIVDRTLLILEIFERGAHSAEGKKQVALAWLQYEKARLAGRGIGLSQQGGGIGTRGPGETLKEKETQHLELMEAKIREDLDRLEKTRMTQRKQRISGRLPLLCLIGYTNAGKSTILNALTKSGVLAENKLFSTLDTTTRELFIDGKKIGLMLDTVGFIQNLPHHLVEAFKSTLLELDYASLLLQVVDLSDQNWEQHCAVVQSVLEELGVNRPMLYVFNKIDKIDDLHALEHRLSQYRPRVLVSAHSRNALTPLIEFLKTL